MTSIYFWASYKTVIVKEKTLGQCWGHCQCDFGDEVMMTIKSLVPPQEENFVTWLSSLLGKQVLIDKAFTIFILKLQQGKEPIIAFSFNILDARQPKIKLSLHRLTLRNPSDTEAKMDHRMDRKCMQFWLIFTLGF